jgi:hypothetical protein
VAVLVEERKRGSIEGNVREKEDADHYFRRWGRCWARRAVLERRRELRGQQLLQSSMPALRRRKINFVGECRVKTDALKKERPYLSRKRAW